MFKLIVSDSIIVPVKGSMTDAEGKPINFTFELVCARATAEELKADIEGGGEVALTDYMRDRTTGWRHVQAPDGSMQPFTPEGLAVLLNIAGMATLAFRSYIENCGAKGKEKNS